MADPLISIAVPADVTGVTYKESFNFDSQVKYDDIAVAIANWALNYNVRHLALNELLCILRTHPHHNLPKDARTL